MADAYAEVINFCMPQWLPFSQKKDFECTIDFTKCTSSLICQRWYLLFPKQTSCPRRRNWPRTERPQWLWVIIIKNIALHLCKFKSIVESSLKQIFLRHNQLCCAQTQPVVCSRNIKKTSKVAALLGGLLDSRSLPVENDALKKEIAFYLHVNSFNLKKYILICLICLIGGKCVKTNFLFFLWWFVKC